MFTDSRISGPFFKILAWTFAFAILSVATTFALGLFLAITFNDPRVRSRRLYRSLLILPYAFPGFLAALVWRGMLNPRFGFINEVLLGGTHVPFDAATLNKLYPTHSDYVAKVTRVSQDLVKAGFLLPADAVQTIDKAKRSIYGSQLVCGPLCADERQFPSHPSSMLLANQTSYLVIKDGAALIKVLDDVTRMIAEGYTLGANAKAKPKFATAAALLQTYVDKVHASRARGNMPVETETLLVDQAKTLIAKLAQ